MANSHRPEGHDDVTDSTASADRAGTRAPRLDATAAPVRPGLPVLGAFLPYLAVAAVHLVCIAAGLDAAAAATKLWLMPLLGVAAAVAFRLRPPAGRAVPILLGAGLAASWAGDSLLGFDGGVMFLAGLGSFLAAHLAYIAAFAVLGRRAGAGLPPAWSLVYAVAVVALAVALWPGLGALGAPVVGYGAALAVMAAMAARVSPLLAAGGAVFLVSDGLLALGRFADWYDVPVNGLAVMLTYTAAQGLIVAGVVRAIARTR